MTEIIQQHESEAGSAQGNRWQMLEDYGRQSENLEADKPQFETELTSSRYVLEDIDSFAIKDGRVYSRETGEEVTDEDTILRAKTSRFLFDKARDSRDDDAQVLGKRFNDRGPDYYVEKMMQRYAIRDEENSYGTNKLVNELVATGKISEDTGGNALTGKYSMFTEEEADYSTALIRRKLRQRGMDLADLKVSLDDSEFQHNGYSHVEIALEIKPLKDEDSKGHLGENSENLLHHPAQEQLSRLEADLAEARKNGDKDAAAGYEAALRRVVSENPLEVTPEQWNVMDSEQRKRFYELKMKEAKTLGDRDTFDFWAANREKDA